MRYELTDHEWAAIKPHAAEQAAWRSTGERSPCSQRHLLGVAIRGALAGFAERFWSLHHLLQSLRSLAACGRLEQNYECASWRS